MRFIAGTTSGQSLPRPARSILTTSRSAALALALGLAASVAAHAQFTPIGAGLTNTTTGDIAWGDYDNDGDLDLVVTGDQAPGYYAEIYNNSGGSFTSIGAGLTAVAVGSRAAWGDYDNDGDLDLIVTGADASGIFTTRLYNNSGGGFSAVTTAPAALIDVGNSSVAWGDYDNDGDLDLFISGTANTVTVPKPNTRIYRNDGPSAAGWVFTPIYSSAIKTAAWGCGAWGDVDNDGDLDLVVSGTNSLAPGAVPTTTVYENKIGVFVVKQSLNGLGQSSLAWGDYNNDGTLDLAVTGVDAGGTIRFDLYDNSGGSLVPVSPSMILPPGVKGGSVAWGDYDNSGTLDMLVVGNGSSSAVADVWNGPGSSSGNFTLATNLITGGGLTTGRALWGDYDNDGKLDIAMTGFNSATSAPYTEIHRGLTSTANTTPGAPTSYATTSSGHSITLSWSGASDVETPTANLHYNVYVRDVTATPFFVMAPMSDISSGYRQVAALGNTDHNTSWTITHLTPGHTYDFCVQTVDGALAGSPFTCATSVTLPTSPNTPDAMIRDCLADVGSEPNSSACVISTSSGPMNVMWDSPDIWVSYSPGGTSVTPQCSTAMYINVLVTNLNTSVSHPGGVVQVFGAKASTGLAWQGSWVSNYGSGCSAPTVTFGDLIGSATVPSISASGTQVVSIPWYVWDPSDYFCNPNDNHFCLFARFTDASDPITYDEGSDIFINTMNNNNIAWRNVTINDWDLALIAPPNTDLDNPFENAATMSVKFDAGQNDNDFLNDVAVVVDLGDAFRLWSDGGQQGSGVRPHSDDPSDTRIDITSAHASIDNLSFEAGERIPITATFSASYNAEHADRTYDWHITQWIADADHPFGGEAYHIAMPQSADGAGKAAIGGDAELSLSARPNPTNGATTIAYTIPEDTRVTLSIYDANGTLVNTLVSAADQKKGSHLVEWNGTASAGTRVPSGTYFYRLQTGKNILERQIKVVR